MVGFNTSVIVAYFLGATLYRRQTR